MSDDNDSSGMIGSIISIFILIAIWPYLLAIIGLYIAYLIAIAVLEWMAANWILVTSCAIGLLAIYTIYRLRLIPKGIEMLKRSWNPRPIEGLIDEPELIELSKLEQPSRAFIPSSNLYCYWCTKKLGINAWEKEGRYYCSQCQEKMMSATGFKNP